MNVEEKNTIKNGFNNWNNNIDSILEKKNKELESRLGTSKLKK
jgi:hypothetical protein